MDVISNEFYFQKYCDDLPVWGYIGKVEDESWEKGTKYYLFTHLLFDVLYNGNQVIEIHAFCDPNHAADVTEIDIDVEFTCSVNWNATSTQFQNWMDKYSKASLLPVRQKIHWFSFINSIIIIVLLMGLLALLIVRRLKNDMKKFSNSDEEEDKEVGWKYIHGDVFRYPPSMSLFCAVLGVGTQLLAMIRLSIRELSPSIERLQEHEYLKLRNCKSLVHLPNTLCNLAHLRFLHLCGCTKFFPPLFIIESKKMLSRVCC